MKVVKWLILGQRVKRPDGLILGLLGWILVLEGLQRRRSEGWLGVGLRLRLKQLEGAHLRTDWELILGLRGLIKFLHLDKSHAHLSYNFFLLNKNWIQGSRQNICKHHFMHLVLDLELYTLLCQYIGLSLYPLLCLFVSHIYELQASFALLLLPNQPLWLFCSICGLMYSFCWKVMQFIQELLQKKSKGAFCVKVRPIKYLHQVCVIAVCFASPIALPDRKRVLLIYSCIENKGTISCSDGTINCADGTINCANGINNCSKGTNICADGTRNIIKG